MLPEGLKCLNQADTHWKGFFVLMTPPWPSVKGDVVIEQTETYYPPPKVPCCHSTKKVLTQNPDQFCQRKNPGDRQTGWGPDSVSV